MTDVPPTDRHGLEVLSLSQCLALLRSRPLGRLAYLDAGGPTVVPVNHLVDGPSIVLRSLSGNKTGAMLSGQSVAFQLDEHDPSRGTGWSVLVRGRAVPVEDAAEIARFESELDSWAAPDREDVTWLRIVAEEISGRRLRRND